MRSKQATERVSLSPASRCFAWRGRGKTLLAQEPVEVLRLVEVLGGIEPNRIDQSRRGEVGAIEIGTIDCDAGEDRAAQGSAPQRRIGEIRILKRCEFKIHARQIRLAQDRPLEIAGF